MVYAIETFFRQHHFSYFLLTNIKVVTLYYAREKIFILKTLSILAAASAKMVDKQPYIP